jgi:PAS domain S-box-containing protein
MEAQPELVSGEVKHLQRCINDLVSLLALPAIWSGGDPSQLLHTLLDALIRMLSLDLVSVRLTDPVGGATVEVVRLAELQRQRQRPMPSAHEICEALSQSFKNDSQKWPPPLRNLMGEGDVSIVSLPLGLQGELGVIVAAAERTDFPRQTETLLLSVAANQASIGLQEAWFRSQQKRIADELDQRVAQRTAELAAANSELQLQVGLLQHLPVSAWTLKPDGTPDFVNQVWLEYSGQTLDFVRSHPEAWMTAIHPEDRETASRSFWDGVRSGQGFAMETRTRRARDGTYRWHLNQAVVLRDAAGKVLKFVGATTDIDDQKRAQEKLRGSEARKTAILESALDCILTIDQEGCITEFNPAAEYTFGYHRDEVLGMPLSNVVIPLSLREKHRQGFARYLATGEAQMLGKRIETTAVRADGSEFPVELAITRIPLEGPPSFTGYLRDITERKRAEEKLRRSESFLAEAQRLNLTGSFSWFLDTDEITFSEELHRIFNFERGTPLTPERISGRVHPEDIPLLSAKIEEARLGGGEQDYEIRLRMPDDSVKYLHTISHRTRDGAGRLEIIGAVQDMSERRSSEEALSKARSELSHVARVTSLGVLTASVAHEVNQPLSGIVTNASTCLRMLAADPPNVDGARETARRTIRDGNRASEVISRLRSLYGKKDPMIESVDLNEATREVLALSLSELQRNRVIVLQELADGLPLVAGDRVQLQQVILNLIRNASDAMSAVDDRPRQLLIRTEADEDDHVHLTVKDVGVGFAPQAADRLFESFYTTKNEGMGIGLSVSRSIIESHHGRLWARLNNGPGATFAFFIPRSTDRSSDQSSDQSSHQRFDDATGADDNPEIPTPDVTDAA